MFNKCYLFLLSKPEDQRGDFGVLGPTALEWDMVPVILPMQARWVRGSHLLRLWKAGSLLRDHMIPRSIGEGAEMSKSFSKVIQQSRSKAKTRSQGSRFLFHCFLLHENFYKQKRGCHRSDHGKNIKWLAVSTCPDQLVQVMLHLSAAMSTGCQWPTPAPSSGQLLLPRNPCPCPAGGSCLTQIIPSAMLTNV